MNKPGLVELQELESRVITDVVHSHPSPLGPVPVPAVSREELGARVL